MPVPILVAVGAAMLGGVGAAAAGVALAEAEESAVRRGEARAREAAEAKYARAREAAEAKYELALAHTRDDMPRKALCIGNYNYRNFPDLSCPFSDAYDMSTMLSSKAGFDSVEREFNASVSEMQDAVRTMCRRAYEPTLVVFFFSGHGAEVNADMRLATSSSTLSDVAETTFSVDWLKAHCQSNLPRGSRVIILLDCCRTRFTSYTCIDCGSGQQCIEDTSGARVKGALCSGCSGGCAAKAGGSLSRLEYAPRLPSTTAGVQFVIGFAAAAGTASHEYKDEEHSVYTEALIKNLPRAASIDRILRGVNREVDNRRHLEQKAWYSSSLTKDLVVAAGKGDEEGLTRYKP